MKEKSARNILLSILTIALAIALIFICMGYYYKMVKNSNNPVVTMEIADYGTVTMELYPDQAPNTVANFVKLVNEGYYNGLTFHRAIADTLVQGGDKEGTGSGSESFAIPGEFLANGFNNTLRHEEGVLSMARADYSALSSSLAQEGYNSGSSQFFILTKTIRNFDGIYCAFGKVTEGLDIIKKITNLETTKDEEGNATETPVNPPVITNMTVNTFGVNYGEPVRVEPFDYYSWMLSQYSTSTIEQ